MLETDNWSSCRLPYYIAILYRRCTLDQNIQRKYFRKCQFLACSSCLDYTVSGYGGSCHIPCMSECKQNALCLLGRSLASVACFWELSLILNEPLATPGQLASDWQAINLSVKFKAPRSIKIFNLKLWQSQNVNLKNVLHIMWVLVIFPLDNLQLISWSWILKVSLEGQNLAGALYRGRDTCLLAIPHLGAGL